MNQHLSPRHTLAAALTLITVVAVAAYAQTRPAVKVALSGMIERGSKESPLSEAGSVRPGEMLRWTILSRNEGQAPAINYQTSAPIPKGTVYVPGSASGESTPQITYSIDGGRAYSAQPMIPEKQPDGTTKMVPAPPTMYTHVRFQWGSPLGASNTVKAYYSTRVK